MEGFKYRYLIASLCKVARTSKSRGTCTDNRFSFAVCFGLFDLALEMLVMVICCKSFKTSDTYGVALDSSYTLAFALCLLGTYSSADCRKGAGLGNHSVSFLKLALCYLLDKSRDIDIYGAACHAGHILTAETSLCFVYSDLLCISQSDLQKILVSYIRLL